MDLKLLFISTLLGIVCYSSAQQGNVMCFCFSRIRSLSFIQLLWNSIRINKGSIIRRITYCPDSREQGSCSWLNTEVITQSSLIQLLPVMENIEYSSLALITVWQSNVNEFSVIVRVLHDDFMPLQCMMGCGFCVFCRGQWVHQSQCIILWRVYTSGG